MITSTENREMFDRIAPYYDGTNKILSLGLDRYWRRRAVTRLAPSAGHEYLDLGCGTGDIALEMLRTQPNCRVTGIDPSEGMLELGRRKVSDAGLDTAITLVKADALALEFPDDSFDAAITAFCLRNITDRRRAVEEIHRVVRPGGSLVILELTEPGGPLMKPLFRVYTNVVFPLVTGLMSSIPAYRYLAASMAHFPKPDSIASTMAQAGFADTEFSFLTFGIVTLFVGRVAAEKV
ncbi:MAG: bifunctional demethylmenaquinone methyltransferase/2-methoxy-6-polyprenyl-1,4-benzoquinol methylase UbiE [Thermodesulfobacteriota bacterium]